jgi:hypothetical protein
LARAGRITPRRREARALEALKRTNGSFDRAKLVRTPSYSWSEACMQRSDDDTLSRGRTERLLQGGDDAAAFLHKLRLIDIEARHRLDHYRSHYDPNQPRVPAGNPDGGQWTAAGAVGSGTRLAAADKPRPGRGAIIAMALKLALRAIEDYRWREKLWDLFHQKEGAVAVTTIDGEDIFGINSDSSAYTSKDDIEARKLRDILVKKYPTKFSSENLGKMPNNALFHAETTVLLKAAKRNGGTLAGRTLTVYGDSKTATIATACCPMSDWNWGIPR